MIVWIASYPKSGNTWVRVFLTNYLRVLAEPVDINDLEGAPSAASRDLFDEYVGVEASELPPRDVAKYRTEVYRRFAQDNRDVRFMKIHDACASNDGLVVPADVTRCALYIVRNPLDVAVSFAHHAGTTVEVAVERMCSHFALSGSPHRLPLQLRQNLLTWSRHVTSWTDQAAFPVSVIRYEDLKLAPERTFTRLLTAAGLTVDKQRVSRAIAFSDFSVLRDQEERSGFVEGMTFRRFFRSGRIGGWREALSRALVERLIAEHGDVMRRFGYLDGTNQPTY